MGPGTALHLRVDQLVRPSAGLTRFASIPKKVLGGVRPRTQEVVDRATAHVDALARRVYMP